MKELPHNTTEEIGNAVGYDCDCKNLSLKNQLQGKKPIIIKGCPIHDKQIVKSEENFEEIIRGIDLDEVESEYGWWETSTGAKFGAKKKEELFNLISKVKKDSHNLALQQVLEKLEEKKFTEQQVEKQQEMGEWNCYSREEYNEALDDAKSIITSLQKE